MPTQPPIALLPPSPHYTLRPVLQKDKALLQARCWADKTPEQIDQRITRAQRLASASTGLGVVATVDQGAVAFGLLTLWTRCAEISDLYVWDAYRNQGFGTAIIQYLVRAAKEMGANCAEIGAAFDNPNALRLYRRLGFVDSHQVILAKPSRNPDVQYLRLAITPSSPQP